MTDDLHRALTGALDKTTGLRGVGSTPGPTGPVCSCPTDLAEILQRTLEHQPAYCPTHAPDGTAAAPAADLAATLDRAIAGHRPEATSPSTARRSSRASPPPPAPPSTPPTTTDPTKETSPC